MLTHRPASNSQGQWSLIGSLVAIAILIGLAAYMIPRVATRHSAPGGPATPIERGYGVACTAYESQMNQAASMYKADHDGAPPRTLDDLKKYGVTDDMIHAQGCAFSIDQTGRVTDSGHGQAQPGAGQTGPGGIAIPNIPGAGG